MNIDKETITLMYSIMKSTNTVEDFISACLEEDISYDEILEYAKCHHIG